MQHRISLDSISKRAKLLIVDDVEDNIFILMGILQQSGYLNIRSTQNPLEVEEMFKEWQPDIVLLDLEMPDMNGFEVMDMIHRVEKSYTPVLVLTARTDNETKLKALKAGARAFITKPFSQLEVSYRIQNNLEVKLLYNEVQQYSEELEQMVIERTAELLETRLEVVNRLSAASEHRDNETGNHIYRMSHYAHAIAIQAGISEEVAELILDAAPMHDVGKIGIPDGILLKPSKLTEEEWKVMRSHSEMGEHILGEGKSPLMSMARVIARGHHERWDGSGYPDKLKGEMIPMEARVVALADVFDALTSKRPYKEAWSVDDAVEEVLKSSGTQFDPALVKAFERALPRILIRKEEFAD